MISLSISVYIYMHSVLDILYSFSKCTPIDIILLYNHFVILPSTACGGKHVVLILLKGFLLTDCRLLVGAGPNIDCVYGQWKKNLVV